MAGIQLQVSVDDAEVKAALERFKRKIGNLKPALKIIGEIITRSVKENFRAQGRPTPWKPLSEATLFGIAGGDKGYTRKGELRSSTKRKLANRKILIKSKRLMDSIHPTVSDNSVETGTNVVYAAIHHFGGSVRKRSAYYGRTRRRDKTTKITIPARPFILIQDTDWIAITEALEAYLQAR